jgi:hypothetical protein
MERLNLIEIETRWGYRTFELYHGDITQLDEPVDLLVISALPNNYDPIPNTVVWALQERWSIIVGDLAQHPEFDFRHIFGNEAAHQCQRAGRVPISIPQARPEMSRPYSEPKPVALCCCTRSCNLASICYKCMPLGSMPRGELHSHSIKHAARRRTGGLWRTTPIGSGLAAPVGLSILRGMHGLGGQVHDSVSDAYRRLVPG